MLYREVRVNRLMLDGSEYSKVMVEMSRSCYLGWRCDLEALVTDC